MIVASRSSEQIHSAQSISSWILQSLTHPEKTGVIPPGAPEEILEVSKKEKLALHLYWILTQNPGLKEVFRFSDISFLKQNYYSALEKVTLLQEAIKELLLYCQKVSLPVILLRGQALGLFYYPDPSLRPSWDVDILTRSQDLPLLKTVCEDLGLKERKEHGEIGFHRSTGIPFHLDVHTELWYESKEKEIWERSVSRDFLGVPCLILSPEDHLVHLVAHSMIQHGRFSLQDSLDMALVILKIDSNKNWLQNVSLRSHMKILFYYALTLVQEWTGLEIPEKTLQKFSLKKSELKWIKFYQILIRPYDRPNVGHFLRPLIVEDSGSRIYFFWSFLFPNSEFIRKRYGVQNPVLIFLWRLYRPFDLALKGFRFIFHHFLNRVDR